MGAAEEVLIERLHEVTEQRNSLGAALWDAWCEPHILDQGARDVLYALLADEVKAGRAVEDGPGYAVELPDGGTMVYATRAELAEWKNRRGAENRSLPRPGAYVLEVERVNGYHHLYQVTIPVSESIRAVVPRWLPTCVDDRPEVEVRGYVGRGEDVSCAPRFMRELNAEERDELRTAVAELGYEPPRWEVVS